MKSKLSDFIINSIRLPEGIVFKVQPDNTILDQDEDPDMYYVYLEAARDSTLYDGLMFSKYANPVETLEKIRKIADELKGRI